MESGSRTKPENRLGQKRLDRPGTTRGRGQVLHSGMECSLSGFIDALTTSTSSNLKNQAQHMYGLESFRSAHAGGPLCGLLSEAQSGPQRATIDDHARMDLNLTRGPKTRGRKRVSSPIITRTSLNCSRLS